jgi:hypothetical protein
MLTSVESVSTHEPPSSDCCGDPPGSGGDCDAAANDGEHAHVYNVLSRLNAHAELIKGQIKTLFYLLDASFSL